MATSCQRVLKMCKNQTNCKNQACKFYHPDKLICNYGLQCKEMHGHNPRCTRIHYTKQNGLLINGKTMIKPFSIHDANPSFVKKPFRDIVGEYYNAETEVAAKAVYEEARRICENCEKTIAKMKIVITDYEKSLTAGFGEFKQEFDQQDDKQSKEQEDQQEEQHSKQSKDQHSKQSKEQEVQHSKQSKEQHGNEWAKIAAKPPKSWADDQDEDDTHTDVEVTEAK